MIEARDNRRVWRRSWRDRTREAVAKSAALLGACCLALPVPIAGGQAPIPDATAFQGTPAVGALFTVGARGLLQHFCTASVVSSPGGNLVLTAAHCVTGITAKIAFVPGYHDGKAPFGVWTVTRVVVDRDWKATESQDDDFAFLVVQGRGSKSRLQAITGGERVGIGQPDAQLVRVVGYPDGRPKPILCQNRTHKFTATQIEFDCGGYADGTSGSPLLGHVNSKTALGTVIGVIGGYEQGGDSPEVSYAAKFGSKLAALYKTAVKT